jgi:hypothetical protein
MYCYINLRLVIFLVFMECELRTSHLFVLVPHLQPILLWLFWRQVSLFAQTSLKTTPYFKLPAVAGMTGIISHLAFFHQNGL